MEHTHNTGNPAEHYGRMLEANGYAKHGQETMISGLTGEEMQCDIYIGLVYYQRLRHMVSDKFQVCGCVAQVVQQAQAQAACMAWGGRMVCVTNRVWGHAFSFCFAAK
eukprot:1154081-Pelagomonas_calceolata.AAC.17